MDEHTHCFFVAALKFFVEKSSRKEIASNAGVAPSYIGQILSPNLKRVAGYQTQIKIASACEYSYFDFLELGKKLIEGGQGADPADASLAHPPPDMGPQQAGVPEKVRQIDCRHSQVIRGFSDKSTACEINSQLVAIEQADPVLFARIAGYIEAHYNTVCRPGAAGKRGKAARGAGKGHKLR
jgi:hypothetical protein